VNPVLLAAAFEDGRDATVALNLMRRLVSIAASSESGDQSWRHSGTRTGEGIKDEEIGMCLGKPLDLHIVGRDCNPHLAQDPNQG
jgi:hypothetical protein